MTIKMGSTVVVEWVQDRVLSLLWLGLLLWHGFDPRSVNFPKLQAQPKKKKKKKNVRVYIHMNVYTYICVCVTGSLCYIVEN